MKLDWYATADGHRRRPLPTATADGSASSVRGDWSRNEIPGSEGIRCARALHRGKAQSRSLKPKMVIQHEEERRSRVIVLDTAALIAGTDNLYALGGLVEHKAGKSHAVPEQPANVRFYITPDVVAETRDALARKRLEGLDRLGVIEQRAPSAEAVAAVADFAKTTGDYPVLSSTDLRVLALCWMLEREQNGSRFLKDKPEAENIREIRGGRVMAFEEVERREREAQEEREREIQADDGWTTVERVVREPVKKRSRPKKRNRKKKTLPVEAVNETLGGEEFQGENHGTDHGHRGMSNVSCEGKETVSVGDCHEQPASSLDDKNAGVSCEKGLQNLTLAPGNMVESDTACVQGETLSASTTEPAFTSQAPHPIVSGISDVVNHGEEDLADSDDGIGWINEENLEEHLARDGGEQSLSEEDMLRVACVTTDFAMQNTMLQMGIKLLSVDGRRTIRQIKQFALRCHSCGAVTRELHRKFCEKCGNASMHRVAYKVDKKGVARFFLNPKKKAILRGTKYPIPLPRGGRHNKDLILCEDQIDPVKQRRLEKQRARLNVDVLDPSNFYNAGARFDPHYRPMVVGYGKRNPNEVRSSGRGKR